MTPELFAQMNLVDDTEIEAIDEQWEANGVEARARHAAIEGRLPEPLRRFANDVCLHDAELRGFETDPASASAPGVAVLNLRLRNRLYTLYYDLIEPPRRRPVEIGLTPEQHARVWAPADTPEWLYDEIDVLGDDADPTGFVHEILLNTGETLRFVFFGFDWHVHAIGATTAAAASTAATPSR